MADRSEQTPGHRRNRWLWRVAILAVILGVCVAGLLIVLHTPPGRRFVVSRLTDFLRQQNIHFDTQDFRYNLFDLSIRFRDLRIRAENAPDLPPFAEIDEARLLAASANPPQWRNPVWRHAAGSVAEW